MVRLSLAAMSAVIVLSCTPLVATAMAGPANGYEDVVPGAAPAFYSLEGDFEPGDPFLEGQYGTVPYGRPPFDYGRLDGATAPRYAFPTHSPLPAF